MTNLISTKKTNGGITAALADLDGGYIEYE
jgi:hypothetical protein